MMNEYMMLPLESQIRLAERWHEGAMRLSEKQQEYLMSEQHQLNVYRQKKDMAERYAEIRRSAYDDIIEDDDGGLVTVRKKALVNLGPSKISNMRRAEVHVIYRSSEPREFCYKLVCDVIGKKSEVFLLARKITECPYLIRKLSAAGIILYGRSKKMVADIMAYLIANKQGNSEVVPDCPGWYVNADQKLRFAKRGDVTWNTVEELCR